MKILSSIHNVKSFDCGPRFSIEFDDGITILLQTVKGELVYENMISIGLNSIVFSKGWPKGKNLEKRVTLAREYVSNNIKRNRYKTLKRKK